VSRVRGHFIFWGVNIVRRDGVIAREVLEFIGGYHRETVPGSN
jgi:hypothetical protein